MICYDKNDIKDLKNHEDKYYMPNALFDTMQYKLVRLEVKWAYVACLNVMLKMLVKGKLEKGINQLAEGLTKIPYSLLVNRTM